MKATQATAEIFLAAFNALKGSEREAFFEKVVQDRRLREELMEVGPR